eukprot:TRINITY_DN2220_c2_g1_i1.p2 TRINITY_DN2220_c2_g1~~TRINITY_DN2220_c2_g1_i1.p2  ORF type:complete len:255 (+),score=62.42 TRINITY_DN2220_c2_g1_i1:1235-1999(+)
MNNSMRSPQNILSQNQIYEQQQQHFNNHLQIKPESSQPSISSRYQHIQQPHGLHHHTQNHHIVKDETKWHDVDRDRELERNRGFFMMMGEDMIRPTTYDYIQQHGYPHQHQQQDHSNHNHPSQQRTNQMQQSHHDHLHHQHQSHSLNHQQHHYFFEQPEYYPNENTEEQYYEETDLVPTHIVSNFLKGNPSDMVDVISRGNSMELIRSSVRGSDSISRGSSMEVIATDSLSRATSMELLNIENSSIHREVYNNW